MTVDATPVVKIQDWRSRWAMLPAMRPWGVGALPPTARYGCSLDVRHPWPTNAPTGGRAGHSGASLSRSPSFHVKAFTVWLEADMRACVIDAHSASNHLRQGNDRDVRDWNDAAAGQDATQQEVREETARGEFGDPI